MVSLLILSPEMDVQTNFFSGRTVAGGRFGKNALWAKENSDARADKEGKAQNSENSKHRD